MSNPQIQIDDVVREMTDEEASIYERLCNEPSPNYDNNDSPDA
jgi:hypothetical protein